MAKRTYVVTMWCTRRWATAGVFQVTGKVDSRGHFSSKEAPYVSGIVGVEFFRAKSKALARAREKKRGPYQIAAKEGRRPQGDNV